MGDGRAFVFCLPELLEADGTANPSRLRYHPDGSPLFGLLYVQLMELALKRYKKLPRDVRSGLSQVTEPERFNFLPRPSTES